MPESLGFDERVKSSFQKVKEDINSLKLSLEEQNKQIKELKSKTEDIYRLISEIKEKMTIFKKSSNRNDGVINDHQRSSTINNNKQQSIGPTNLQSTINELAQTLAFAFQTLTDREFSVFTAIFELNKTLPEVTYTDLANKLNIAEPTIRNVVNTLISKKVPLQKNRFFNKKVSLSIPKDLHDLNLLSKLIKLHQNPHNQKTLFDVG